MLEKKKNPKLCLKYDKDGLIPVIVQDYKTNEVLMLAYMNEEALAETLATGKAHFFSRSRKKLWLKGEESGHYQTVRQLFIDCDNDVLLIKVHQSGGACHTGYRSCFFKKLSNDGKSTEILAKKVFDPKKVYKSSKRKDVLPK